MAHIHEKIDFTVTVYVVYNDRVLLRMHEKYHCWFGVGGHIELDEDANQAALRETLEEAGLNVTLIPPLNWENSLTNEERHVELIPPSYMNIHFVNETSKHQHHDLIYFAVSTTDEVTPESPDDQWAWLTEQEIAEHTDLLPKVRFYAQEALRRARAVTPG